jgi:hypothetical protein
VLVIDAGQSLESVVQHMSADQLIKILPREAEISLASMIASVARSGDESESLNAFKLVEADDD